MRTTRAALATAVLLAAHNAAAQATSVATARQLAISGIDAVEAGNCDKGVPLLERAEQLHHASVHLQYLARCRAKSGKLVAATEMWRRIIRDGAPEGASPAVVAALTEAQSELDKALPRLASTTVRTTQDYPGLSLTIDGTKLPADMVGTRQILDPGDHELVVTAAGFQNWARRWTLAEGGTAELVVDLTPLPEGAIPPTEGLPARDEQKRESSSFLGPAGWITASVGAASLIAGTVTVFARDNRKAELAAQCPGGNCQAPPHTQSEIDSKTGTIHDLTAASNVLLWGGGALLAGGVTLIVIDAANGKKAASREPGTALLLGAPRATAGLTVQGRW